MPFDQYIRASVPDQGGETTNMQISQIVTGCSLDADNPNGTKYLAPSPNVTIAAAAVKLVVVPFSGMNIKCLYQSLVTAPGAAKTSVVTVQKSSDNGATYTDTALTCTATAVKSANDTSDVVAVAKGDVLAIKWVTNDATAAGCTASFILG